MAKKKERRTTKKKKELATYCLRSGASRRPTVELWTTQYLTSSCKGWRRQMRNELRELLAELPVRPGRQLSAIYSSKSKRRLDVENLLLHNVGVGVFADLAQARLRFERRDRRPPPPPKKLAAPTVHYHRYQVVRSGRSSYWNPGGTLAHWEAVIPYPRANGKPHEYWYAMKTGKLHVIGSLNEQEVPFGLRLRIYAPEGRSLNLVSAMKSVLDGVMAAVHQHDGEDLDEMAQLLVQDVGTDAGLIQGMLTNKEHNALGTRRLAWPHGGGVQWNPADEDCHFCEVSLLPSEDADWHCHGELFRIAPL